MINAKAAKAIQKAVEIVCGDCPHPKTCVSFERCCLEPIAADYDDQAAPREAVEIAAE